METVTSSKNNTYKEVTFEELKEIFNESSPSSLNVNKQITNFKWY